MTVSSAARLPGTAVELLCSADRMTLRLRTAAPFTGRIFSLDAPSTCDVRGTGQLTTEATFIYHDRRCGVVRESVGSFTALVAVQHHSTIQKREDSAIKLLCSYEATEQTVSNGITLLTDRIDGGLVTSSVNGTAPTPIVSLHVRDRAGEEVTGTALGEPLYLSLEMQDNSRDAGGVLFLRLLAAAEQAKGDSAIDQHSEQ
ncbi:uncharacterized protein LOC122383575 [Amphibalanus amphitrite]|uniref:uncharacterized protein LOC122383575 n=1 Tax=Amphibalanus amphitrite TaxID=1232801 RepID=UPI001C928DDE|nr:uncharacterized protein LOC122383575 [Amphibalanus amphitrite]